MWTVAKTICWLYSSLWYLLVLFHPDLLSVSWSSNWQDAKFGVLSKFPNLLKYWWGSSVSDVKRDCVGSNPGPYICKACALLQSHIPRTHPFLKIYIVRDINFQTNLNSLITQLQEGACPTETGLLDRKWALQRTSLKQLNNDTQRNGYFWEPTWEINLKLVAKYKIYPSLDLPESKSEDVFLYDLLYVTSFWFYWASHLTMLWG